MKAIIAKQVPLSAVAMIIAVLLTFPVGADAQTGRDFFGPLQQMLVKDGFEETAVSSLFRNPNVYFDITNISRFFSHRESRLNYDQFITDSAISKARRYMETYQADLEGAEKTYAVEREVITAIILVETQLGTIVGNRSVFNSLSSLASLLDPAVREQVWREIQNPINLSKGDFDAWAARKSKWAYAELKSFLQYTQREAINPTDINGSIAGALGIAQFMPSSIIAYAKDGDSDGRVDLFNHADAIASIASYLKHYGWKPGIDPKKAYDVVFHYNRSSYYVNTILEIAERLKN
ncbi:MAG: lytic murein transglycosylase [Desulfobacterales bacterium]|nr:lytic murein transglycosylase [Desulfobacterales bacterium]